MKWAQGWCKVTTREAALKLLEADEHPPNYARIKGPLRNSRNFREAFNCSSKESTCELGRRFGLDLGGS